MRRIALTATAVLAITTLAMPGPAVASDGWSTRQRVGEAAYEHPSMVVDDQGAVHIAARGDDGLWYLSNETGSWTSTRLTQDRVHADGTESAGAPRIARDPADGSLVVAFVTYPGGDCGWCHRLSYVSDQHPGGPGAWSTPQDIPSGRNAVLSPTGLVVRRGVISVAASVGQLANRIRFFTTVTGEWTHEDIRVSGASTVEAPSLARYRDGRPVMAYTVFPTGLRDAVLRLAVGSRPSGGFTTTRVAADWGIVNASLALDAHGATRVAWDDEGTSVARETAAGWSMRHVWRDSQESRLQLGPGGRARVVGLRGERPELWYAARSAGAWHETRLTRHATHQVAFAVDRSDGDSHVVYPMGGQLWYTHTQ